MKCNFCGREVEEHVAECPYCHYQFKKDAQVLSERDRDNFAGVTIEEDGSTKYHEEKQQEQPKEDRPQFGKQRRADGQDEEPRQQVPPQFKVKTMGCSSSLLLTVLILAAIVGLFFFMLPTLLIFAAIGAVVVFVLRLFV